MNEQVAFPRWLPGAVFLGLTLVLFRDFVFGDGMLLGSDTLNLGYVARAFYAGELGAGRFPGWAPHLLGGTPFLEALSGGDALYPTSLLLLLTEPYRALGWKLVLHVLLAGPFMFGWMRSLGASRSGALLSSVAFMLAPSFVSLVRPGHDGKLFVVALTPLLFWATERWFGRPTAKAFAIVGLVVGLIVLTTHFQMAYFLFGATGCYAIFRATQIGRSAAGPDTPNPARAGASRFALFVCAAVLGLGAAAVQFAPAVDYVTEHSRRTQTTSATAGESGRAWSSSWSMHPEEAMSLLIPEFAGNGARGSAWSSDTYWGRNFLKDNSEYGGIVALILAILSFAAGTHRMLRIFLAAMGSVALLFALGAHTPVWGVAYALLPGIRLFRSPSMAIFLFSFAVATLAGLGLDGVLRAARDEDNDAWGRILKVAAGSAGVLVLLALLASSGALTSVWTSVVYPDISPDRVARLSALRPLIAQGAGIAALLGLTIATLIWLVRTGKLPPAGLVAALALLTAGDELRVDAAFVQTVDFEAWSAPDPNMQALLELEPPGGEPYRLLSFVDRAQDVRPALYGVELAAGHHPNDLGRYRELIGMTGSDLPRNLFNPKIEQLLNVRYLLWPDRNGPGPPEDSVVSRTYVDGQPWATLHARPGLPRARLVADVVVRPEADVLTYVLSDAFQPAREVVLSVAPSRALEGGPVLGSVTWIERSTRRRELTVTSDRDALLVLAENWFPSWHATVDGTPTPILRAYHTLQAIPVPAGTHTIRMSYRSPIVTRSLWLSATIWLLLVGLLAWGWSRERRRESA